MQNIDIYQMKNCSIPFLQRRYKISPQKAKEIYEEWLNVQVEQFTLFDKLFEEYENRKRYMD